MRGRTMRFRKLDPNSLAYWVISNQKGLRSTKRFTSHRQAFSKKFKNCRIDWTFPKGNGWGPDPLLINTFQRLTKTFTSYRHLTPVLYGFTLSKSVPIAD